MVWPPNVVVRQSWLQESSGDVLLTLMARPKKRHISRRCVWCVQQQIQARPLCIWTVRHNVLHSLLALLLDGSLVSGRRSHNSAKYRSLARFPHLIDALLEILGSCWTCGPDPLPLNGAFNSKVPKARGIGGSIEDALHAVFTCSIPS